jgi:hypothetical protein
METATGAVCLCCESGDHGQHWVLGDQRCSCPCHCHAIEAIKMEAQRVARLHLATLAKIGSRRYFVLPGGCHVR